MESELPGTCANKIANKNETIILLDVIWDLKFKLFFYPLRDKLDPNLLTKTNPIPITESTTGIIKVVD